MKAYIAILKKVVLVGAQLKETNVLLLFSYKLCAFS